VPRRFTSAARTAGAVLDGDAPADTDTVALTGLVQAVWQGLSIRSDLGASHEELLAVARLALELISQCWTVHEAFGSE
jgi:TetR/AcrR family transcriptional regulator, copper-responsive repressor